MPDNVRILDRRNLLSPEFNTPPAFDDSNEITFNTFGNRNWDYAMKKLDSTQTAWEQAVGNASDKQLKEWSTSIANICAHNSYHTGQIVYIRKKNGWWDESRGVK